MKRNQTYQVVSRSAVTVEFSNGNVVSYPTGFMFQAHPTNQSVTRLLRQNLIRSVTSREVPRFGVDTQSNTKPTPASKAAIPPLQAATRGSKKKSKKPSKGEE